MLAITEPPEAPPHIAAQLAAVSAFRPAAPMVAPVAGKRRAPPNGLPHP
jgi:hypothetical protein